MYVLRISAWVLRHQARSPLVWMWTAVFAALWPAVAAFTPLGVTTSARGVPPLLYEVAFMACVAGSLIGMSQIEANAWLLQRASHRRRTAGEAAVIVCSALPLLLAGLAPPGFLGAAGEAFRPDRLPAGTLLALAHVCAVALILGRLPIPASVRMAALPLLVWGLPALAPAHGKLGQAVGHVFDASRHLHSGRETNLAGWSRAMLPIIGLLGVAHLLVRPPVHKHAIRDSR